MAIMSFFGRYSTDLFLGRDRKFFIESPENILIFDLLLDENHNLPFNITTYRIEDGSDITENIYLPPRTASITGFISSLSAQNRTNPFLPYEQPVNRVQESFDTLKQLRDEKEPITIITNLDIYEEVLLTDIQASRSAADGESQTYTISFIQSNIVQLQSVAIEATIKVKDTKSNRNRQASNKINVGRR